MERCPSGRRSTIGNRVCVNDVPRVRIPLSPPIMVISVGPLATRNCELRQVRKEATAAMDVGAGVWLALIATLHNMRSL